MAEEKEVSLSLPGEWALKQAFGPVLGELGEDMKKLYAKGRDKIIIAGYNKIKNKKDGKSANLRVTRDVFWNGSFTDNEICAEYFGGILSSSRSEDGKDDSGIYYVDIIKSLSSKQLELHYLIYTALNKLLISNPNKADLNPSQANELKKEKLLFSAHEFLNVFPSHDVMRDLHLLYSKGLIASFQSKFNQSMPYLEIVPSVLGVQLYAVAHNNLDNWRRISFYDFGEFDNIESLELTGQTVELLNESVEKFQQSKTK